MFVVPALAGLTGGAGGGTTGGSAQSVQASEYGYAEANPYGDGWHQDQEGVVEA